MYASFDAFGLWHPPSCSLWGVACQVTVGHPFDSVKTQLQTVRKDDPDAPRTFLPMALYMLKHRGVGSFYAGFTAPAVQKFLGLGFLLGTMESLKHAMGATLFGTTLRCLVCCMICGFFESFIYCPLDLIKARLQVGREKSVMESVRAIIRIRGRMGLYLGWRLHCMKEMLGNVAMFIALEVVETGVLTLGGPAVLATALGGSASGIAYNVVPHPIDTVKSVVQTKPPGVKITAREGVTQLLREGGVRRLYSGVAAATLRSIFGSAAMFLVFAALKN